MGKFGDWAERMKPNYLILTMGAVLALTMSSSHADDPSAPPVITIAEYAQKNSLNSVAAKQFVFMRCGALYAFYSSVSIAASEQGRAEQLFQISLKFADWAQRLETNKGSTFVDDQVLRMNMIYMERAKAAKANTGNWSDDQIIRSDGPYCKQFVP